MSITLVLTVHDRAAEVSAQVAASFMTTGNLPDAAVIVLDRPTEEARAGAIAAYGPLPCKTTFVELDGPPGWLSPVRAWNAGFAVVETEYLYAISSEVVQEEGNLLNAELLLEIGRAHV